MRTERRSATMLAPVLLAAALPLAAQAKTISWPQPGMNAAHTGYNAKETVISKANVGSLVQKYAFVTQAEIFAAPVQVGKRAYVLSTDGNLYAINAITGAPLWTYQVNQNGAPANWGVAASAKIVYVNCQLDYDNSIYRGHAGLCALNAATGAKLWDYAIYNEGANNPVDSAPYNPPVLVGNTVVLGESDSGSFFHVGYTVALDAKTGAGIWGVGNCNDTGFNDCNFVSSAPIAASGGGLFFNAGQANGGGSYMGALCRRDVVTGNDTWCTYTREGNIGVAVGGGKVVFIQGDGNANAVVTALNQTDGSTAWTAPLGGPSSPDPTPAIANGIAYVNIVGSNGYGSLYALSLKTGKTLWNYAGGGSAGYVSSGVSVANGVVYAVCRNSQEQCAFDAKTGAVLRLAGTGGEAPAVPLVANGAELSVCGYNNLCRYTP
jgi:outer membrane protein assembly factor BamB